MPDFKETINHMLPCKFKAFSVFVFIIALIVLLLAAYSSGLHTDENWSFSESYYYASGLYPHLDFFSHRLPFGTIIYGEWLSYTTKTLESGRILSVLLSASTIAIISYVVMRLTGSIVFGLASILIFSNSLVLYLLSGFSAYPLVVFLFSLSCLALMHRNKTIGHSLFLMLNSLIWMSRYLVDAQAILLIIFYTLFIYTDKTKKSFVLYTISAFIFPLIFIVIGGEKLFFDTVTFNFQQVSSMVNTPGVAESNVSSFLDRFIHVRKLEIREYFPIIILSVVSVFLIMDKTREVISNVFINGSSRYEIILYSLIFIFGYYSIILSGWDFPVTKIYLLPAVSLIIMVVAHDILSDLSVGKRNIIMALIFAPLLFWPFIQAHTYYNKKNSAVDLIDIFEMEFNGLLKKDGEYLTFMPVLLQNKVNIDRNLSMEIFSLLHKLSSVEANHYHLASLDTIIKKIKNKRYAGLILHEQRFKKTKGMGALLNEKRKDLNKAISKNYYQMKSFVHPSFGEIILYNLKPE